MGITNQVVSKLKRAAAAGVAAGLAFLAGESVAGAQEILLTGPLAGAPAVRKLKLYRQGRFELAPAVSFSLLDEYQRQIFVGGRINYNLTDWLAIGAWGASGFIKITTALSEDIQTVNEARRADNGGAQGQAMIKELRLSQRNIGPDFPKQLGTIDWVVAPQLTLVPFRGKIALFQSIFADTDLYFFGGPAFVGVKERDSCEASACNLPSSFEKKGRVAIAPTFGLGFSFFVNKWNAFGFEWRGLPFARNTGGFDNRGGGQDELFPNAKVDEKDREFKFNQMLTVSWGFFLPTTHHISE